MNVFVRYAKKLKNKLYRALGVNSADTIPTHQYDFKKIDAKRIYTIVLSGNLHHKIGSETKELEHEFADYHKTKFAVSTNSGTSALEMALKAIGIKPGDEVIVPAYTFVATAQAVLNRGGIPIFADIDDTYTISPESVRTKISKRTKAIIPVHIFGNPADMDAINSIAKDHKLKVIEDACQAVGARYKGKPVGSLGDIGCFSFDIKKAIYTGQGGMLITSDKKIASIAIQTRETGQLHDDTGSDVVTTGNTYALTEMQSALARIILNQLNTLNDLRRSSYNLFVKTMDTTALPINWYRILPLAEPSFSRLVFMINFQKLTVNRKDFLHEMKNLSIPLKTFYPVPLYKYSLFQKKRDLLTGSTFPFDQNSRVSYTTVRLPYAEKFCASQVGMDFSPYLKTQHIHKLTTIIRSVILKYTN